MSRVFVVQQPAIFDHRKGCFEPKYDLSPACVHGELVFLLEPGNIFKDRMKKARETLRRKLEDFTGDDFLLAVGDPVAIALTVMLASERVGDAALKLLKWDRKAKTYEPFAISCR